MTHERLTFDLFEYAAFRQSIGLQTEPRAEFKAWLAELADTDELHEAERLTLAEWAFLWRAFCDEQDAKATNVDQSERSDGLEDTADAALGGHFEPVAL